MIGKRLGMEVHPDRPYMSESDGGWLYPEVLTAYKGYYGRVNPSSRVTSFSRNQTISGNYGIDYSMTSGFSITGILLGALIGAAVVALIEKK